MASRGRRTAAAGLCSSETPVVSILLRQRHPWNQPLVWFSTKNRGSTLGRSRHEADEALAKSQADLREQQKSVHRQEVKQVAAEARSAELAEGLFEMRQQGRELAKKKKSLSCGKFGVTAGEWVPSRGGGTGEVRERSLQCDFMHEKIKVSRLERKVKIMDYLLAKLRTKTRSLHKQASRLQCLLVLTAILL